MPQPFWLKMKIPQPVILPRPTVIPTVASPKARHPVVSPSRGIFMNLMWEDTRESIGHRGMSDTVIKKKGLPETRGIPHRTRLHHLTRSTENRVPGNLMILILEMLHTRTDRLPLTRTFPHIAMIHFHPHQRWAFGIIFLRRELWMPWAT